MVLGRQIGETLYDFLQRRERELEAQTTAVRSELAALETELAHVKSATRTIGNLPSFGRTPLSSLRNLPVNTNPLPVGDLVITGPMPTLLGAGYSGPLPIAQSTITIKELILKALWAGFRDTGATQAELRQYIKDAYGREIDRGSISPQISRLRDDHLIKQKGGEDNWRLTKEGIDLLQGAPWFGETPTTK